MLTCAGQVLAIGVRLLSLLIKVQPADVSRAFIQSSILDAGISRNSIVALNALALDPTSSVLTDEMIEQLVSSGIRAAQNTDVQPNSFHADVRITFQNREFSFLGRF